MRTSADVEIVIERRATDEAQLARVAVTIEDGARARHASGRCRPRTPPIPHFAPMSPFACRAPRLIDRVSGPRRPHRHRRDSAAGPDRRHPPRPDRRQGCLGHAASRSRNRLGHLTDARSRAERTACGCARSTVTCGCRWPSAPSERADPGARAERPRHVGYPADDARHMGTAMGRSDPRQRRAGDFARRGDGTHRDQEPRCEPESPIADSASAARRCSAATPPAPSRRPLAPSPDRSGVARRSRPGGTTSLGASGLFVHRLLEHVRRPPRGGSA